MFPTDSSIFQHTYGLGAHHNKDNAIKVGMVREEKLDDNYGIVYVVDVYDGGRQVPVDCIKSTQFGGVHNYEEFNYRPWVQETSGEEENPYANAGYEMRSGDVVIVAFINGNGREGVILGALPHPARNNYGKENKIEIKKPAYYSCFNGLDKTIYQDGQYKIAFNGLPTNDAKLNKSPDGSLPPKPEFNEEISGSYYGFDKTGSFISSTASDIFLKLDKTKHFIAQVKSTVLEVTEAAHNIKADSIVRSANKYTVKTKQLEAHESLKISLKATQIAIGNDQFELFDGLIQLIDAFGTLIVTSPVGTCTPLQASPSWAAQVLPLKLKMQTLKTSLESADDYTPPTEVSSQIGQ